jgi:type IV fimbrial biogenesis protein FimT
MKRLPLNRARVPPRLLRAGPKPSGRMRLSAAPGVTLIELLAVIAIVAILLTIGIPSYQYISTSYRISSEANGLLGDLQFARGEAIKEGQTVTACISTNGSTCAAAPNGWHQGWIVFSDVGDNQTATTTGDTVLRVQSAFTGTDTFEGGVNSVTFSRDGFALGLPNGGVTLTLHNSTSNSAWTRCLELNVAGIMSIYTHITQAGCV